MKFFSKTFACAAALAITFAGAPAFAKTAKPAAAMPSTAKPALWKLSDPDTTIYLFGTIHVLPKGITWLEGPVATALDRSDTLVTEIPEVQPASMQALVGKLAVLPKGQSLKTVLPAKDYTLVNKALADNGIPAGALDPLEPWFVAVTLSTLPLLKEGYSPESGVEAALQARAKTAKVPQIGLETAEFQLGIFDALPQKSQVSYLREVVKGMPKLKGQIDSMVRYWAVGNHEKLGQMMNSDQTDPALMKALLTNRNRNWTGWIKQRLDQPGTVFIAVGAGHLAGKDSVQSMLKKQGFKLTRVQ
jgi:uncharacterized protein YbaP (TraB family)